MLSQVSPRAILDRLFLVFCRDPGSHRSREAFGILEFLNFGILAFWNFVFWFLEFWSFGGLGFGVLVFFGFWFLYDLEMS